MTGPLIASRRGIRPDEAVAVTDALPAAEITNLEALLDTRGDG